jgi:hypothetical protein
MLANRARFPAVRARGTAVDSAALRHSTAGLLPLVAPSESSPTARVECHVPTRFVQTPTALVAGAHEAPGCAAHWRRERRPASLRRRPHGEPPQVRPLDATLIEAVAREPFRDADDIDR